MLNFTSLRCCGSVGVCMSYVKSLALIFVLNLMFKVLTRFEISFDFSFLEL